MVSLHWYMMSLYILYCLIKHLKLSKQLTQLGIFYWNKATKVQLNKKNIFFYMT